MTSSREIVVTGLGVVSSLGFDTDTFFKRLIAGDDGTGPITSVDTQDYRRVNAAEIQEKLPEHPPWKSYNRASQIVLHAVAAALQDAGLNRGDLGHRAAVSLGSMIGGTSDIEREYIETKNISVVLEDKNKLIQYPIQSVADVLCYEMNIQGLRNTVMTACASGTTAIGIAMQWIKRGRADIVICGGYDVFRPLTHLGLASFRIIAPDKVRPFDTKRKGILVGEGAGILILESEESARRRGKSSYAKVLGYGASCDANDLAHPEKNGGGMGLAMEKALLEACIDKEMIGYINAHGTGTNKNDSAEIKAIQHVFGAHTNSLCVSSIKGAIGHTIGAAGGIEAVATVLSLVQQQAPPTINSIEQDKDCAVDIIPNRGRNMNLEAALSNSFGFGGNNASIIFGRV
ncbi:beta-ketoacyl-[acyl-carrier-protein] synthase family protein [Bacillus cereus]|uniref:beta-ketoacyl-[acyl-carrier-protein] synthase family protein n=1 Tax=Bacillus cereus TaxID=1396 RepID=UPI00065BDC34|nr:beta-ketoacyl-[acyl-carrier-protein] synthase family protein [Bacillus cereus]KMQ32186.1 hypothetical protein TU58_01490 [Bacillus cereus]